MKKITIALLALLGAACSAPPPPAPQASSPGPLPPPESVASAPDAAPPAKPAAHTLDSYKVDLAQRISQVNSAKVYDGRPQALLRSVVVLRYSIDSEGKLMRSEILRSNRDSRTEATALASLKIAAPFPKPARHLLRNGRVDVAESWLFNSDGRFQLRSIAQAQLSE